MQVLEAARQRLFDLTVEARVLKTRQDETLKTKTDSQARMSFLKNRITNLHVARKVLQEIVERVGKENLVKIENFVNQALGVIFTDLQLTFKIEQDVKRGNNTYSFAIYEGQVTGCLNSFGGGVVAIISVILKLLFNLITKRFPLLVLDETLIFLHSKEYMRNTSKFLSDFSRQFCVPVVMVTQVDSFAEQADICYRVDKHEHTELIRDI